jgi:hypothetical protein
MIQGAREPPWNAFHAGSRNETGEEPELATPGSARLYIDAPRIVS